VCIRDQEIGSHAIHEYILLTRKSTCEHSYGLAYILCGSRAYSIDPNIGFNHFRFGLDLKIQINVLDANN